MEFQSTHEVLAKGMKYGKNVLMHLSFSSVQLGDGLQALADCRQKPAPTLPTLSTYVLGSEISSMHIG